MKEGRCRRSILRLDRPNGSSALVLLGEVGTFRVRLGDHTALKATGKLTLTGNPLNAETVTLDAITYTFKVTLTGSANEVKIGASAGASRDNLVAAIMATAGAGTIYGTGTTANTTITAVAKDQFAITLTAVTPGTAGNALATTETSTVASFGAATLAAGAAAMTYAAPGASVVDGPSW